MKTRLIHTKFYQDEYIQELSATEKFIFLYLFTNSHVNIINCYECSDRTILFETGVTPNQLNEAKKKFELSGRISFSGSWIKLINGEKYQKFVGEKNETAKTKLEMEMPASIFCWYKDKCNTPIDTPIDRVSIGTSNQKSVISNQKSEKEDKKEIKKNQIESNPDYLVDIPREDIEEFSQKFELQPETIVDKAESMHDWYLGNPKRNRKENWKATLRNAIRKDAEDMRAKEVKTRPKAGFNQEEYLRKKKAELEEGTKNV